MLRGEVLEAMTQLKALSGTFAALRGEALPGMICTQVVAEARALDATPAFSGIATELNVKHSVAESCDKWLKVGHGCTDVSSNASIHLFAPTTTDDAACNPTPELTCRVTPCQRSEVNIPLHSGEEWACKPFICPAGVRVQRGQRCSVF